MSRIKLVSANISNYFETNKIEKRDSIPVSGNYTKGDLIINTGSNSSTNPMWICTETGTPGKWAPVTSGNSYTHPDTHPATMITEDSTHRFVTDDEKTKWNSVGDKSQLQTIDKNNLVAAINELNSKIGAVQNNLVNIINEIMDM